MYSHYQQNTILDFEQCDETILVLQHYYYFSLWYLYLVSKVKALMQPYTNFT